MWAKIIVVALSVHAASLLAAQRYDDNAYARESGDLLYRETHFTYALNGVPQRLTLYRCPDGRPFGRKIVHDDGNAQAPDFDMYDARTDYREGVRSENGKRVVYVKRGAGRDEISVPLKVPPDGVIDSGFNVFVHRHWDALSRGDTLRFSFLVPSRRHFFSFKLSRLDSDSTPQVLALRLSLGAWYAFLAPHIDVRYDRQTRHLLRFAGMSNVRDLQLKNYDVRVEFDRPAVTVDMTAVDAARRATLTPVCAASASAPH